LRAGAGRPRALRPPPPKLEVAAARLGIRVSDDEVERHLPSRTSGADADAEPGASTKAEGAFVRSTVRAQLLTQKVFVRVTREVTVPPSTVRAYYRAHRGIYGRAPFRRLATSIRTQLISARRNATMARWLAEARRIPAEIRDSALRG
jgi:hypothetical protein